jgi:hypothetical protein
MKLQATRSTIVGPELAAVLPVSTAPWYLTPHLAKLNAFLLVILFSSAGLGFDGSMMNGLQSLDTWTSYFNNPSATQLGVINGVLNLGPVSSRPFRGVVTLQQRLIPSPDPLGCSRCLAL